ncbi:MAG: TolC family outer membrane protein, partial [Gammaproteobacteria bacterium]
AEFTAAEQDLMIRTATRYFLVLGAMDNLEFAQSEKDAIARQLDQTRQRFEVGLIAITDVHEAQARYDLAVSEVIKAETLLYDTYEALEELTGTMHKDLQLLVSELPLIGPDPDSPEQWVQTALQQNYRLIAAKAAAKTAHQEIERRRSGRYPTLDLTGGQSYRDLSFGGEFEQKRYDSSIGLRLNVPLYQGGLVNSQTRESRALYESAQAQVGGQQRATTRRMRDTYRRVNATIALVKALSQALISTRAALEAAEAGYEVGTRTIVDVLNAQREVFRAKRDFARARYDYLLSTLRMKQAAGILSGTDVKLVSSYLRPTTKQPDDDIADEKEQVHEEVSRTMGQRYENSVIVSY